ncbi:2-oxo acid dehydrogenase subunit E2 [Paenibacillus tengchongensis]|uniref:2-oxo acid dehydrogenase subunit E2 n=1 Tax=Paenibacillus tengchongensis TaxID=2608684 RepID=UPI001651BB02|nr:2-oxo acid dehydrogenase subunit E2 [Paenibacillus tengchongensis]
MFEIVVPQLNANDEECTVQAWHTTEEAAVQAGELLATLETSKAVIDVEAESDGYFYPLAKAQSEVKTGETLALIFATVEELRAYQEAAAAQAAVPASFEQYTLSNQARAFAELHQFTAEELSSLNKKVIKLSDLEGLLAGRETAEPEHMPLSKNQKQVARTVTASYQSIPRAFLLMKVYCDGALAAMRELGARLDEFVGFGEVLPGMLSELRDEFPLLYGSLRDEETFLPAAEVNVGVTLDAGTGLYIPVIRQADLSSIERVTEVMAEYKYKALRGSFEGSDLTGGCITVSLNTNPDVISVLPIILPGQTGMISVGGVTKELALQDGEIVERSCVHLGLAYDHRVINGFYAVGFLTRLKERLERFTTASPVPGIA